jgi:hypothetical protein
MADPLDYEFLRTASPQDVALHLRQITLSEQHSPDAITQQLLQGVESGALPPMVYALWTSSCPDHSATLAGLQQSHSVIVRSSAIRNFRRRFRTADCESLWSTLGGTQGIVRLLRSFSVIHVKEFCKAVARCSTSKHTTSKRQELVTDLLRTLTSENQDSDDRSLLDLYAKLVYTCTPEQKDAWIAQYGTADLDMAKLFETDVSLHRRRFLEAIATCGNTLGGDFGSYSPLFNFIPREPDYTDVTVSSSMSFALRTLQLIQKLTIKLVDADWLDETIRSLLARLVRKKASAKFTSDALDAMAYCAPQRPCKQPRHARWREDPEKKFWLNIMRLWRRDPSLYEQKLTPLVRSHKESLELSPRYSSDENNIEAHVLSAKVEHRYRLLRWILANHNQYRIDIDHVNQLKHKDIETLSERLLLSLPRDDALRLFDRFELARPGKLKLATRDMRELDKTGDRPLSELLRLHLLDDPDAVFREGQGRIKNSKQMAEDSGSQPIRSAWINASVYFAVASRSLDLLQDTVIWARRFSRDPKTAQELYGSSPYGGEVFPDEKTVSLLSGIPERIPPGCTLAGVARDVRKGNEVTLELLHSAVLAQSEPFFQSRHWGSVFILYRKIVEARLRRVDTLQFRLRLTDDQIYSAVWQDTLDLLLKAEQIGLKKENEGLNFGKIGGPLQVHGDRPTASTLLSPATLRFIEELAIQRERIWIQRRVVENPAVSILEAPWPRGLPIQALWFLGSNDDKRLREVEGSLPFLASKAKSVVFVPAEHALRPKPVDGKSWSAIGECVDSYALALRLYLSWCTPAEKDSRLQDAWIHATETLRGDRMTALESRSYWNHTFAEAGAKPTALMMGASLHKDPRLPVQGSTTDPTKWHPDAHANLAGVKRRELDQLLVVDCFKEGTLRPYRTWINDVSIGNFWDLKIYGSSAAHVPGEAREAFIAAAILALNRRSGAGIAIFGQPFPVTNPRFPALSLDEEALTSQSTSDKDLTNIFKKLLSAIPPTLLLSLASGLIEKSLAENARSNDLRTWTSFALQLLVRSDKPQLATDIITRVILENPGETPWHQVLLTAGYFKRLSPDCAKKLVQDLTNAIVKRLDGQSNSSEPIGEANKEAPGPYTANISTVKVTTVKLLAQVLKEASFLGGDFIVNALATLFSKATHVHIRAVIVDSLAAVLLCSRSAGVREAIVDFLETTVVSVAAELNERSPMTESDWNIAEQANEPPEVYSDAGLAPICAALVKAVKSSSKSESLRTFHLVDRILLSLIKKSRENNTRWLKIFLHKHKHNASNLVTQIPASPSKPQLLELLLLKFSKIMPAADFENFSDVLTFATCPPKACKELTARLESQHEAYEQNDTRHWLRISEDLPIARSKRQSKVSTVTDYPEIVKSLQTARFSSDEDAVAHNLITPAHLRIHERKILDLLAADFPASLNTWKSHTAIYEPPIEGLSADARQRWRKYCQPLVHHAVSIVESLRTEGWQRDLQRTPSVLPDTFQLQLWLLPYPSLHLSSEREQRILAFASEVRDIVHRLASSGKPYHTRWPLVQQALHKCPKQDYITLALQLGALEDGGGREPNLAECLCVELADGLLKGTEGLLKEEIAAAKEMLRTWKSCFDEDVRRIGEERLEWIKGKIPSLPSAEQQQEEEVEEEIYDDDDEDKSDESEYDEDY